jgi:hypothetical protein
MPWKTTLAAILALVALALAPLAATLGIPDDTVAAGQVETMEGCLGKSGEGTWLLTDAAGTAHVVVSDKVQLADHDGHKVKVTGEWKGDAEARHFHVTALEHVAASCG